MSKSTIYVSLMGRLGNNLFQIAAAVSLAKKYNSNFIAIPQDIKLSEPDNCSLSDYLLQFKDTILNNVPIQTFYPKYYVEYNEPFYQYQEIPYQENILISGYFQSEKYFNPPVIRELFKIPESINDILQKKYGSLLHEEIVSINIRRGDYILLQSYHPLCSLDYYNRAINIIGKDKQFMITSDDLSWCKENFVGDNFHFVDQTAPEENLYLQTLCTHNIISNSSFSWWGAWLNPNRNKKVIAPLIWYGPQASHLDTKDLLPDAWLRI